MPNIRHGTLLLRPSTLPSFCTYYLFCNLYNTAVYCLLNCFLYHSFLQDFNREPVIPIYSARPDQVEKALKHVYNAALNKLKGKELELLLAILPDNNGSLYGARTYFCILSA